MSDIKSMLASMNKGNGSGDAVKKATGSALTIEKMYQKKSQLEHILLRPDTYIGSVEYTEEPMWIYDFDQQKMILKKIGFVPGLYKIFDEILVNAADNKVKDKSMTRIKIVINQEDNLISVWNNGQGIPVTMHKDENMYVPTMIFGHLLTSSNYNDEEEKVTGGRNGYGAKLCNIFSTKFVVETGSKEYKKLFKQTWTNNMSKTTEPKIKDHYDEDYTKITFSPDLSKFKMVKLDDDIVALMNRRAFDIAATTNGVEVFLNDKKLPIKNFMDYVRLYTKDKESIGGTPIKIVRDTPHERWQIAATISDREFQQVSFVNSIATTKGGKHVEYVTNMLVKELTKVIAKKNKSRLNIRPPLIKSHLWLFINCSIVNPAFDAQTKQNMTTQIKNFGSSFSLTPKFITELAKIGIVELVLAMAQDKAKVELDKTSGTKRKKVNVPKLEEANKAGGPEALKCTLILTEGDSAKSMVVSGLGVIGRNYYGVFPLRGKLLNVREATSKQILENKEICFLLKILGLQYKKTYNSDSDMKTLRYGKVMIMTDQDQDGSHIKGLVINFFHNNWPELLKQNFLEEFITPIVKVKKNSQVMSFYSLPEYEEWKMATPNYKSYSIKYYKGLGTSDSKEAKEYFGNMRRHRIPFQYSGQQDDDHIVLAFSKKHVEHRKEWLTNFMVETKRRKEIGLPERYLYEKNTKFISYTDFINKELVLFSNGDNIRSIPCLVDGVKPGQRKVLYTVFKRNDKKEVKVLQLAGSVAERTAYHHGETSLCSTIVNLAQNFVGSNNINLLEPRGQFGTRLCGGKDSASPRYIFTKMSPLARVIFHPADDSILKHEFDDNMKIEPVWFIPIIPMILVNGADGIGTGWMTKIPNYNPREIVANIFRMLDGEEPEHMIPWYKGFSGTLQDVGDYRYVSSGEIAILSGNKLEISELPIGTWTQPYKENLLEILMAGTDKTKALISDYQEYSTDTTVKFVITLQPGKLDEVEKDGLHKVFKLQSMLNTSSMCAFDQLGCLRRFESVTDILKEYYTLRLQMYQKRKDFLEGALKAEADKLSNQARFVKEKCSGELVVENKKRNVIVDELIKKHYDPDPLKEWKDKIDADNDNEENVEEESGGENDDEEDITQSSSKKVDKTDRNAINAKMYDYLLGMSMWMLTHERKNELLKQRDNKLAELEIIRGKTPSILWREDLNAFLNELTNLEDKEKRDAAPVKKETKGKKKNFLLPEIMPSPNAQRVVPTISEDMRKKIQYAVKSKENRNKRGIKKDNIAEEETDEFDMMVQSKKVLKDKIGTPEEVEKRTKAKKQKDNFKQTKLNFNSNGDDNKTNGRKGKQKKKTIDSGSESGDSYAVVVTSPIQRESKRTIKPKKYMDSDYDIDSDISMEEDSPKILNSSFENKTESAPSTSDKSEDLFDSLIGAKTDSSPVVKKAPQQGKTERKRLIISSDSDVVISDFEVVNKKAKEPSKKKKKPNSDIDKPKKKNKVTTKYNSSSDESIVDDHDSPQPATARFGGRARKPIKYNFDSDNSE